LAELRSLLKPNEAAGLYAISVDPAAESRQLAEKIARDGRGEIAFPLLSDPGGLTVDAYGLRDPAYAGKETDGIPRPAVYVIGKTGRVAWAKIESDYKKRPTNSEMRAALDALKE
jgi:peroxiredoxin